MKLLAPRAGALVALLAITLSTGGYGLVFWVEWNPIMDPPPVALWVVVMAAVGGMGLAFHKAMLPLHLLLAGRLETEPQGSPAGPGGWERSLSRLGLCLVGFGVAFVLGIGGWPPALARPLYAYAKGIARIAGGVLFFGGLVTLMEHRGGRRRGERLWGIGGSWKLFLDGAAGLALGVAFFHDIDPTYDSVFFATGTAVAASHWTFTVAVFVLAAAATLLATAWGFLSLAGIAPYVAALLRGLRFLGAAGTMAVGILLVTGAYEGVARTIGLHR